MAFAFVNPVSALWQRRGLTTLLMPEGYNAFAAPQQEQARTVHGNAQAAPRPGQAYSTQPRAGQPVRERQPWQQSNPQQSAAGTHGGANQDTPPRQRPQTAGQPAPQAATPHHAAQKPDQRTAVQPQSNEPRQGADQPAGSSWLPLPPHVWPAPWQTRLTQTRPGPVLWTYWNLGPDLCDPQTPGRLERRHFLQRLLQDLGHPAGTHTFWPSCLPPDPAALPAPDAAGVDQAYAANPDVFWSGAMQLKARGVVVMGSAAANAVALPGGLRPPQQIRHRGKLVWVLWDVDNLLRSDQRYASMLALLREALRHILR
ncbi:hypothetical protein [Desulfovibrio desulfuricans]|uniref:hypothetical protein n=1 Tax=Desulfovibrio desulfuricans TaxID=876 RepID=UPI0035B48654